MPTLKKKTKVEKPVTLSDLTRERRRLLGKEFRMGTWIGIVVGVGIKRDGLTKRQYISVTVVPLRWYRPGMFRWRRWFKPRFDHVRGQTIPGHFRTVRFGSTWGPLPGHQPLEYGIHSFNDPV